ncbi:MAG: hypothetical protein ABR950_01995 [Candidatus Dormibacteria bacterium]|jgi:hypothetical protein
MRRLSPGTTTVVALLALVIGSCGGAGQAAPRFPCALSGAGQPAQPGYTVTAQPSARAYAALACDPADGSLILFGGGQQVGYHSSALDDTWRWTGEAWTRLRPAVSPPAGDVSSLVPDLANRTLLLFQADGTGPDSGLVGTWAFGGSEDWTELHPAAGPPAGSTIVETAGAPLALSADLQRVYQWTGSTWLALTVKDEIPQSDYVGVAFDPVSGDVIVPLVPTNPDCGYTGSSYSPCPSVSTAQTWGFDVATRTWHRLCLGGLGAGGISFDQEGMASYSGGVLLLGVAGGTWRWGGSSWSQVAPAPDASKLGLPGMALAYDPTTGEVVGFGGYGGFPVQTDSDATWTWDGNVWTARGESPPPRPPFAPCTSSDDLTASGGDTLNGHPEPIDYSVEIDAFTACHLTGTAVFTLVDTTGETFPLEGNPASTSVNAELSPEGDALRITYRVSSACIPLDTVAEFTVGTLIHQEFQGEGGFPSCAATEPAGAHMAVASVTTFG